MEGKCGFLKINRYKKRLQGRSLNASQSSFYYNIAFELSSTTIRDRVRQGLPITGLVMPSVEKFIKDNFLYKHPQVVRILRSNKNHMPDKEYRYTRCGLLINSGWEVLNVDDGFKPTCSKCIKLSSGKS